MDVERLKIDRGTPAPARGRRRARYVGPLVFLAVVVALLFVFQRQVLGFVDSMRLAEVRVQKVLKRSGAQAAVATGTSSNGYIVARTRAALSADTPGRIVEMRVEEGSVVKKGDVVARLYADEYKAALQGAEADLKVSDAGRARAEADVHVSERELEQAQASARAAEVGVAEARTGVDLARIEFDRSKRLIESGVGNQERLDRAKNGLDAADARLKTVEAELEATRKSIATGEGRLAVSQSSVKEAEARMASSRAARDLAQATLDKTEVRAPFDGIVVLKDAEVGEVVSPNVQGGSNARGSVVTMVDFASLEVQAEVPETNLQAVRLGAPARIYLDAFPEKAYPGRVDRIWPTANRSKATVEVRVVFEERDDRLRPEMGVRVVFVEDDGQPSKPSTTTDAAIVVPQEALVRVDGTDRVFVLERDVARLREVVLGAEQSGRRIVSRGLSEGELIVLGPPASLTDGQRVRVKD